MPSATTGPSRLGMFTKSPTKDYGVTPGQASRALPGTTTIQSTPIKQPGDVGSTIETPQNLQLKLRQMNSKSTLQAASKIDTGVRGSHKKDKESNKDINHHLS